MAPAGATVAVLSYGFWQSEFGGRDVIGQTIRMDLTPMTIIGVAPRGFIGASTTTAPAMFIPLTSYAAWFGRGNPEPYWLGYNWDMLTMLVRRKPGVAVAAASSDLTAAYIRSRAAQRLVQPRVAPDSIVHPRAIAGAFRTAAGPDAGLESATLRWVTGVAMVVLLIACANVTNLVFARTLKRRRELAMRRALGVSQSRLVMQVVTETLLLSFVGSIAGILIAQWGGAALRALVLPESLALGVLTDWRTLGAALTCALGAGLVTAIGPALASTQGDLAPALRAGAREGTYHRSAFRSGLIVAQAALSVVLLIGAGLFVRSVNHLRGMRLGYDPEPVLMAQISFRSRDDSGQRAQVLPRALAVAQSIPGVASAARVNNRPFSTNTEPLYVPGVDSVQRLGRFVTQVVTPDYFNVVATRILLGRPLTEFDRAGTERVMVVSDAMARVIWPAENPIGKCVHISHENEPCTRVVGVAENAAYYNLTDALWLSYYVPVEQFLPIAGANIVMRITNGKVEASMERVRVALQAILPSDAYVTMNRFEDFVAPQRRSWVLGATMFVAFGGLALVVAAVGLYGVMAYTVAQRMHEFGVRMALGAQAGDVVRLVIGQGTALALAGIAIGLTLAVLAARWIQPLLFQQSAVDPLTYGVVSGSILLVGVVASALPALRATSAAPSRALRDS